MNATGFRVADLNQWASKGSGNGQRKKQIIDSPCRYLGLPFMKCATPRKFLVPTLAGLEDDIRGFCADHCVWQYKRDSRPSDLEHARYFTAGDLLLQILGEQLSRRPRWRD